MVQIMKTGKWLLSSFSINKMMIVAVLAGLSIVSCDDDDDGITPVASFEVTLDGSFATFTNTSVNAEEVAWTFGEGSESNEENPTFRYSNSGDFEVFLLAINGSNTSVASQVINVEVPATADPSFTFEALDREVTFTNTSAGGVSFTWDFGDGSEPSTEENPVHTYEEDGVFDVVLTAVGAEGDEASITNQVEVVEAVPVANFTFEASGLMVEFTNTSTDGDTFTWDFGDGTGTSTEENPTYEYQMEETFTVELTATNANGNTNMITMDVTVVSGVAPVANFTSAVSGFDAVFTDTSVANDGNITAYAWDFGDGIGTSSDQNPTYTYGTTGDFDVTLTITFDDLDGVTTATTTQTITVIGDTGDVVQGVVIRDTNNGGGDPDTGELRYNIDPLLSGRLEVTFTRTAEAIDMVSGNNRDGFISLLNSTGSTGSQRSIFDLRVRSDSYDIRDQDFTFANAPTPGVLQTVVITWTAPDAATVPMVTATIDGIPVSSAPYMSGENSIGGVERVQFRFGDNDSVISPDSNFTITEFELFSDVDGNTSMFATDFSEFGVGAVLGGDDDPFNNNTNEAVVEIIE